MLIETNFYKDKSCTFSNLAPKARFLCSLGGSVGLIDSGLDGGGAFSLSSSSSNTMGFSTDPSLIDKSSNVVREKGVSMLGLNTESMSNCEISQMNSISSRSVNWWLLVSKAWVSKLESNSSLISNVPFWLGVMGTRGKWLSKKSCLWDTSNCQAARVILVSWLVYFGQDHLLQ